MPRGLFFIHALIRADNAIAFLYSSSRKSILALTLSKKILSSRSKYKPSNVVVINPPFVFLIIKSCSNSFASIWVSAFSIIAFDVIDEKDEKSFEYTSYPFILNI